MAPARSGAQDVAGAWRRGEPRPADEVRKAAGLEGEAPAGGVWLWGVAKPRGRGRGNPKSGALGEGRGRETEKAARETGVGGMSGE